MREMRERGAKQEKEEKEDEKKGGRVMYKHTSTDREQRYLLSYTRRAAGHL